MSPIDTIREFIIKDLHWTGNPRDLTEDYPLIDAHVIDSLGLLSLIAFLEDEMGVDIADEELLPANFSTLAKIAALVEEKRITQKSAAG